MSTPFDPGLQPERTELAWRRTALSMGIGSLVSMRLLPVALGHPAWTLIGIVGFLAAVLVWIGARRRYAVVNDRLHQGGDHALMPGGPLLFLVAVIATAAGVGAVIIIATIAVRLPSE